MKSIQKAPRLVWLALIVLVALGSCKSRKKAMEATKAAEKARMEQEAATKKQQEEDERKRKDAEEQARLDEEARKSKEKVSTPYVRLEQYFASISESSNVTSANNSITEALSMFASPDTPVLIVISGTGEQKDYDRPTTIKAYLNYLKDQKKNINKVESLQFDDSGKITEVELRK